LQDFRLEEDNAIFLSAAIEDCVMFAGIELEGYEGSSLRLLDLVFSGKFDLFRSADDQGVRIPGCGDLDGTPLENG
jgi:hypothetical protein